MTDTADNGSKDKWRFDLEWFEVLEGGRRAFFATPVWSESLGQAEAKRMRALSMSWCSPVAVEPDVSIIRQYRGDMVVRRFYDDNDRPLSKERFQELRAMLGKIGKRP